MMLVFKNAKMYEDGKMITRNISFDGVALSPIVEDLSHFDESTVVIDNMAILPGFCDVHVHLREPGFSYKETIKSGTLASARGGYTAVCSMPNLSPVPDSKEHLEAQLEIIRRDACIPVYPYGSITVAEKGEELSDMEGMADDVIAFSDDGKGVQNEEMMISAMKKAKSLNKMIVAHCEDNSLLRGGYIHDGEYARAHGHKGICSESEWGQIDRDLKLAEKTGVAYHVCHISTKESVDVIRKAKALGVDVTTETGPHYILLDDSCLEENGRFKMNPPLRSPADREAILEGILDGTIDMIATDHAPHSAEEKGKGLQKSAMGVVGIETAFPLLYTGLVKTGKLTLERLVELMSVTPRKRFGINSDAGFTVFDLNEEYSIDTSEFLSKGKSTPFEGVRVFGKCLLTVYEGKIVYCDIEKFEEEKENG
ncbi:MAG: dihydroorotase [Clostridia bacterium]|nr:dihydroorotase [Clostridia bacterium]